MRTRRRVLSSLVGGLALTAGCVGSPGIAPDEDGTAKSQTERVTPPSDTLAYGYTHITATGNRVLPPDLAGGLPGDPTAEVSLPFEPAWVTAVPKDGGSVWAVVGTDGAIKGIELTGDGPTSVTLTPESLPAGTPPLAVQAPSGVSILPPPPDASTLTHPVVSGSDGLLYVTNGGAVVLADSAGARARSEIDALPDARIVAVDDATVAVLADATDRYAHGALGDDQEAGSVVLLDVTDGLSVRRRITMPGDAVIEGILPTVADLTGDGTPAIVVTVADADRGARLVAYATDGTRIAAGPAIGSGFRWRHQLAVAPFPPDRRPELAVVRTPHIGGIVEFYRLEGDRLQIVATAEGYSSHAIGSRNLDGGLAADCDGDGRLELLVPDQSRSALAGLRRGSRGVTAAWRVPLGGQLATNVMGIRHGTDRLAIGVGRRDGSLLVWT